MPRVRIRPSEAAKVANSVSTLPPKSSYVWGLRVSPLAFALFHLLYLARLLSPLQWIKYGARRWRRVHSPTNYRLDIPSSFTEVYFLSILAFLVATFFAVRHGWDPPEALDGTAHVLGWLLFGESVAWIVYYLIIRTFVERRYTIYHPAEYLLTFPVVVAAQMLLVTLLTGRSLSLVTSSYAGNPVLRDRLSVALTALGLVYLTAAISVLLSSHPGIPIRPSTNLCIIGGGDVTSERILPALSGLPEVRYGRNDILVVTLEDELTDAQRERLERHARVDAVSRKRVLPVLRREFTPTIIASPTSEHLAQIAGLCDLNVPFAVEKPIVGSPAEREILTRDGARLMRKGFALSYYTLEKALPLTYFLSPLPVYRRFLESEPADFLATTELQSVRDALGQLRGVSIELLEGRERSPVSGRAWTEEPPTLRTFVETAIHPLLVLRHVLDGAAITWAAEPVVARYLPQARRRGTPIAPTFLDARATARIASAQAVNVRVVVGKWMPRTQSRRIARIDYAHGSLHADFDALDLRVHVEDEPPRRIAVRTDERYHVLMQLFVEFAAAEDGWDGIGIRFDDFYRQLDALVWWDQLCNLTDDSKVEVLDYDDSGPPGFPAAAP